MIDPSDDRIMVCAVLNHYLLYNVIILLQFTNGTMWSRLYIRGNKTNTMSDSGIYICQIDLTIAKTDLFTDVSDLSSIVMKGKITLFKSRGPQQASNLVGSSLKSVPKFGNL